jgi:hypothetical protein
MVEIIRTEPALGDLDPIACDAPVPLSALPFFCVYLGLRYGLR